MSCSLFPTSAPPPLPVFQSLLVKGPYHPSAPVHLSLSHARQPEATKVVCLVASRAKFGASLKEFNDDWLNKHTGDGATHAATRKVDILSVFLSALAAAGSEESLQLPSDTCAFDLSVVTVP